MAGHLVGDSLREPGAAAHLNLMRRTPVAAVPGGMRLSIAPFLLLAIATIVATCAASGTGPDCSENALDATVRQPGTRPKGKTVMQGVGGAFIALGIATASIFVYHFLLRGLTNKREGLVQFGESEHSFSDIYGAERNLAGSVGPTDSAAETDNGTGHPMRHSLSFEKPDGSWVHMDKDARV